MHTFVLVDKVILFLTDGEPTDSGEDGILEKIRELNSRMKDAVTIMTYGLHICKCFGYSNINNNNDANDNGYSDNDDSISKSNNDYIIIIIIIIITFHHY